MDKDTRIMARTKKLSNTPPAPTFHATFSRDQMFTAVKELVSDEKASRAKVSASKLLIYVNLITGIVQNTMVMSAPGGRGGNAGNVVQELKDKTNMSLGAARRYWQNSWDLLRYTGYKEGLEVPQQTKFSDIKSLTYAAAQGVEKVAEWFRNADIATEAAISARVSKDKAPQYIRKDKDGNTKPAGLLATADNMTTALIKEVSSRLAKMDTPTRAFVGKELIHIALNAARALTKDMRREFLDLLAKEKASDEQPPKEPEPKVEPGKRQLRKAKAKQPEQAAA